MSDFAVAPPHTGPFGRNALKTSAVIWFLVAVAGQWTFVYYILANFGTDTLSGNFENWNESGTIDGYIADDLIGNIAFALHVMLAAVITFGGTLQLIPQLRARAKTLHRWNGRVFMLTAVILAVGGVWMVWGRGTRLSDIGGIGITGNAVLILICAAVATRFAVTRQIDKHRRWAMRTFILVNGVWFYRVGFMGWILVNQGPVGSNDTLTGPFDLFMAFGSYLLPLGLLELYLRAQDSRSGRAKIAMAATLFAFTLFMAAGIVGAYLFMWSPHI